MEEGEEGEEEGGEEVEEKEEKQKEEKEKECHPRKRKAETRGRNPQLSSLSTCPDSGSRAVLL